ncbi:DUF123 domain-containing protein [Chloroflexota bacterium]
MLGNNIKGCFLGQSKGAYVLLVKLPEEQTITVGRLKDVYFPRGYYAYVGSAMGGVKARVSRHLRRNKKLHWHIDYLLEKASVVDISVCQTEDRAECAIAQALGSKFDSIPGFGSSDCHCQSHLFFAAEVSQMKAAIEAIPGSLAMTGVVR